MKVESNIKRCVVYTRKSTEEGLDLEFNSLDAQYEACAAYIKSQSSNGWRLVGRRYDDGGYSGGNVNRPALRELQKDITDGLVDIVVVYKIDRLSRSLCDFTDLSKLFEEHGVSFVSVTQQIDTSNAAGRMMLNILMSFAQFEREMTADRIRDKIYATRKKGMWTGGVTPFGYKVVDKRLEVDPDAAETVRMMFRRYAATASTRQVARELNDAHIPVRVACGCRVMSRRSSGTASTSGSCRSSGRDRCSTACTSRLSTSPSGGTCSGFLTPTGRRMGSSRAARRWLR